MSVSCLFSLCWDSLTYRRASRDWTTNGLTPNSRRMTRQPSTSDSLRKSCSWGIRAEISDQTHNLPVARRGITATPATVDYEGAPCLPGRRVGLPGQQRESCVHLQHGWLDERAAGPWLQAVGVVFSRAYSLPSCIAKRTVRSNSAKCPRRFARGSARSR